MKRKGGRHPILSDELVRPLWGAFALLEIVIVLAVILMLFYAVMKMNSFKGRPQFDRQTEKTVQDAGINTESYITMKESMKNKIDQITQQHAKDLDDLGGQAGQ